MAFDESLSDEKTEQPTARRRDEARREGRVALSPDLSGALVLLGGLGALTMAGGAFLESATGMFRERLSVLPRDLTTDSAMALVRAAATSALALTWPLLMLPLIAAVAAPLLQTRFTLAPHALRLRWERIDPRQGLSRLFGGRGAMDALKASAKLAMVGGIAGSALHGQWSQLLTVPAGGQAAALAIVGRVVSQVWLRVGMVYLLLGGLDYGWQWWQHEKSLRMSKEQVRQESREQDGDPMLRGRLRALHKKMVGRRTMFEVRRADVVLRNPTHYAVALRYESGKMRAPRVVAKGERLAAERIIAEARRHDVPLVENPPLTRALYRAVAVGGDVPHDFYRAVAEVLAHVYALRNGRR